MEPQIVVTGFRVVKRPASKKERPKPISRSFVVREAAEQFARLAQQQGINCHVELVQGIEGD